MPGTVKLHRVLRCPPSVLYRAFIEPAAQCKWLPPYGFVAQVAQSDVRVGGSYKMSFTNFRTGQAHSFGGTYVELTAPPPEGGANAQGRIRYTDRFDDPNLKGAMDVTISLRAVACGTELSIVQEGIPDVIPVEMCYLGWQESLEQLARLVEPDIP